MKVLVKPQRTSRDTLVALAYLSGLDNTERLLVAQMLAKPALSPEDQDCLQTMRDRHLSPDFRSQKRTN